ncbi:MAG: ATPase, T2SS/T4P/T4SS family [Nitrososphaeria archaeon]|nr:ATPase, T2SS/T4P/T4SS family [Nitrososphaeria archaeon]
MMNLQKIFFKNKNVRAENRSLKHFLIELFNGDNEQSYLENYIIEYFEILLKRFNGRNLYYVKCSKKLSTLIEKTCSVFDDITENSNILEFEEISFKSFIEHLSKLFYSSMKKFTLSEEERQFLSTVYAFEFMKISRLFPLLIDEHVQEFYLDSPLTRIYLDHDRWGRCLTNIILTEEEVQAIKTHMQTFSGYSLDYLTNSLKTEWNFNKTTYRISLDIFPLSPTGFNLDVRKIFPQTYTLPQLIQFKMLSKEMALFLLFFLNFGRNVTIVGETNSGKTTLLNALDLFLSPEKRRIYVEDVQESLDLLKYDYHQAKYRVSPYDVGSRGKKSVEVTKILHRSPNIIILGEIQSEEHSRALFNSLSSGIRGMQTFHATSPHQAFRRWIFSHKIDPVSLLELDIIVCMGKTQEFPVKRFVSSIYEILPSEEQKISFEKIDFSLNEIFARNVNEDFVNLVPLENTYTFKKLMTLYSESHLKSAYEKMCKIVEPILEKGTSFETLVKEISNAWVMLKDAF